MPLPSQINDDTPEAMLDTAIARWPIAVTFEECRAHPGIQTRRQGSDNAIGCSTPLLLGLYSLCLCPLISYKVELRR